MSDSPLLIVGRGSIGRKHESNAAMLGVPTVAVDPGLESGAAFRDLESAWAATPGGFSRAIIATPAALHLRTLSQLLDLGVKDILLEKPLCTAEQEDEARRLSKRLRTGRRVFVGFNWRFNSAVAELRRAVASGELGELQAAFLYAREWLPKFGGNVLLESGSHILDTARRILGDLRVEGAHLGRHGEFGKEDESASIVLSTSAGSPVLVHVNFVNKSDYDYRILVQGRLGTREVIPNRTEPMHLRELKAFLAGDAGTLASWQDGLDNLGLLAAVFERDAVARMTKASSVKSTRRSEKIHAAR